MKINNIRFLIIFCIAFTFGYAQELKNPNWVDMIECKVSHEEYINFTFDILQNENFQKRFGIEKIKQDNPFIEEYKLPKYITIYNYTTNRIAFTSAGIMAIIDEKNPKQLAKKLNMNIEFDSGDKILATKIISQSEPKYFENFKSLELSTITSHPNKTLIGCSYSTAMKIEDDK
jgi:hypothetical protein